MEAREEVEVAGATDREAAVRALVAAFDDDPVATWTTPSDRHRPRVLRRFFETFWDARAGDGTVYVDGERHGAAIWALPNRWRLTAAQNLRIVSSFAHPRHWPRAPRVGRGLTEVELAHPKGPPHFHLIALGVDPSRQGQGLGSRLIAPILRICDEDGIPAYLESSKESNIRFYARHGFRVTAELPLPAGPTVYPMWREPLG